MTEDDRALLRAPAVKPFRWWTGLVVSACIFALIFVVALSGAISLPYQTAIPGAVEAMDDDYPKFSRMPGSEVGPTEADFDSGEVSGMRSAGIVFLLSAATGLARSLLGGGFPLGIIVQPFLGVQMLRLRHSWRSWAMLGAGLGALLGVGISVIRLISQNRTLEGSLLASACWR